MAKSLTERLQLKSGQALFLNFPNELINEIANSHTELLDIDQQPKAKTTYAFVAVLVRNSQELRKLMVTVWLAVTAESILWIVYPKKSSGIPSDLNMMSQWEELTQKDYRPVASAAINAIWSGIRFKPNHLVDAGKSGNSLIEREFSEYIDIKAKTISLPPFMNTQLLLYPKALERFNNLSYSNKKEYVMAILTAKQEKTKESRMKKIIETLITKNTTS